MGLKQDMLELQAQNEANYSEYQEELKETKRQYAEQSVIFNQLVGTINGERLSFRKEIRSLYDFLQAIGGDLKNDHRISIFDFVDEKPAPIPEEDSLPDLENLDLQSLNGWDALWGVAFGAIGFGASMIYKHNKNKETYNNFLTAVENMKNAYDEDIYQRVVLVSSLQDAIKIAMVYRNIIVTVRDTIAEKIIPELELIQAFLYADAIRENLIEDDEISNIKPCNIVEYKGRKQDIHYQFVRNTFDFYKMSTTFFKKAVLTDILDDRVVTEGEKKEFHKQIYAIKNKMKTLESQKVI